MRQRHKLLLRQRSLIYRKRYALLSGSGKRSASWLLFRSVRKAERGGGQRFWLAFFEGLQGLTHKNQARLLSLILRLIAIECFRLCFLLGSSWGGDVRALNLRGVFFFYKGASLFGSKHVTACVCILALSRWRGLTFQNFCQRHFAIGCTCVSLPRAKSRAVKLPGATALSNFLLKFFQVYAPRKTGRNEIVWVLPARLLTQARMQRLTVVPLLE